MESALFMPQITLKLSKNIDISKLNLKSLFTEVHEALGRIPNLDNRTCFSGMIHEDYSYVGHGDENLTKIFLEVLWLETAERKSMKPALAAEFMSILTAHLAEPIKQQSLILQPRVRILDLGTVDHEYYIYKPGVGSTV